MFDIGFTELLLVGVVALIVVGPEKLPDVIRTALGYIRKIKSSFAHIKDEVERELDLDNLKHDLQHDLDDSKQQLSQAVGYDDLQQSLDELRQESESLRDIADDGYEYADSHQGLDLPGPDSEADTGVEPEINETTEKSVNSANLENSSASEASANAEFEGPVQPKP